MSSKIVLITGASDGIGAETARLAATRGYDVVINYRKNHAGAEAVAEAVRSAGRRALLSQADVSDPDQIAEMFALIDAQFGQIDALVNNAGIVDETASVTDLTYERLQRIFGVNVIGAMLVAKETVNRMLEKGGGSIVNVSSAAARLGSANQYVDYAASKAAIDTFTKGLADEVAARGIRVNAVRPGIIATDIHAKGGLPDRAEQVGRLTPMARSGSAREVADAILWLLSDEASYVTGAFLDVSGGR